MAPNHNNGGVKPAVTTTNSHVRLKAESNCCGCRSWTWLTYLLLMLSLTLSIVVFWFSLFRHQELEKQLQRISNETGVDMVQQVQWLATKNERRGERHETMIADLRREMAFMQQQQQQQQPDLEERIKEIRSNHGNIINSLTAKLSGWESANGVTLKVLNRLKTSLHELEEANGANKQNIGSIVSDVAEIWRELGRQDKKMEDFKASNISFLEIRRQILEELMQSENVSSSSLGKADMLEFRTRADLMEAKMRELQQELAERISEAADRLGSLHEALDSINATLLSQREEEEDDASKLALLDSQQADMSALRQRLSDLDLRLDLSAATTDTMVERVTLLEEQNKSSSPPEEKLELLQQKVEHFVQSLLKVKTLPSVVNALERRVDDLARNFVELTSAAVEEEENFGDEVGGHNETEEAI